jgi:hypothetical protein
LISKFSMDIADWNGLALRRRLVSADRFNDSAMCRALRDLNTPDSKSSASLFLDTAADHLCARIALLFLGVGRRGLRNGRAAELREADLGLGFRVAMANSCVTGTCTAELHRRFLRGIGIQLDGLPERSDSMTVHDSGDGHGR